VLGDSVLPASSLRELWKVRLAVAAAAQAEVGTDAAVPYLISLRCLAAVVVAIPVPQCSPLQPAITVARLPITLLFPVEEAVSHQSLLLGTEKFNFVYVVEKP